MPIKSSITELVSLKESTIFEKMKAKPEDEAKNAIVPEIITLQLACSEKYSRHFFI